MFLGVRAARDGARWVRSGLGAPLRFGGLGGEAVVAEAVEVYLGGLKLADVRMVQGQGEGVHIAYLILQAALQ